MPTCPSGHDSASTDFCDICGMRMGGVAPVPAPSPASAAPAAAAVPAAPEVTGEPCPQCGAPRTGQFCEVCGFSFASAAAPRPAPAAKPDVSAPSVPSGAAAGPAAGGAAAGATS